MVEQRKKRKIQETPKVTTNSTELTLKITDPTKLAGLKEKVLKEQMKSWGLPGTAKGIRIAED